MGDGVLCTIQYVARNARTRDIVASSRDVVDGKHTGGTDEPFEFRLKRGTVIPGLDLGVETMLPGHRARFIIRPSHAYAELGDGHKVLPGDTLDVDVELLGTGPARPRLPTQSQLKRNHHARESRKAAVEENSPTLSVEERLGSSERERQFGNSCFGKKQFEEAKEHYDRGFMRLFATAEEWDRLERDEKQQLMYAKLPLHLNRALCKLKLGNYDDALWDCDRALELDATSSKALFRRASAFIGKCDLEIRKEDSKKFWDVSKARDAWREAKSSLLTAVAITDGASDPAVAGLQRELHRLHEVLARHEHNDKEDFARLFREKLWAEKNPQSPKTPSSGSEPQVSANR